EEGLSSSSWDCASPSTAVGASAFAKISGLVVRSAIVGNRELVDSTGTIGVSSPTVGSGGGGIGWNSAGCSIGVGFGRPRETITLSPTLDISKNFGAKAYVRRMQPCDAG